MKTFFKQRYNRFIFLSLSLHALILVTSFFWTPKKPQTQTISMEIIEQAPAPAAIPPSVEKPDTNKIKKATDERIKFVDQADKPLNNEIDPDTLFLSKNNQRVAKQTVAKNRGEFKNMQKAGPAGKEGSLAPESPMKRFLPQFDVSKAVEERDQREKLYDAEAEKLMAARKPDPKPKADIGDLNNPQKGTGQDATKGSEVSQTLDRIKYIDPGLETLLSSKEFKFYSYFSRIRTQLNHHWTPVVRKKVTQIYQQGRSIASTNDMTTRCLITLDKAGKLVRVQIIGNSGVVELDEAAIEAFRAAAPFPNPPAGMVDPDGTIKIRWDFILEA